MYLASLVKVYKMRLFYLTISFVFIWCFGFAKESTKNDTLQKRVKDAKTDSEKISVLQSNSYLYFKNSPQKAIKTAHEALKLAVSIKDDQAISSSYFNLAVFQQRVAEYDSAKIYYTKSLNYCSENEFATKIYDNFGILYRDLSLYDSSLYFHNKSLRLKQTLGNQEGVASTYNNIGNVYVRSGSHKNAIENYTHAKDIYASLKNKEAIASVLINIGDAHKNLKQFDKAISALEEALEMQYQIGNKGKIAYSLHSIGNFYFNLKIYDKAQEYYSKALEIRIKLGDKNDIASSRFNIATVHRDLGNYKEALKYYKIALDLRRQSGNKTAEALTLTAIGGLYKNREMYLQAIHYYKLAIKMQEEIGSKIHIASSHEKLGIAYKDTSLYNNAIKEYTKARAIYLELENISSTARINNYIGNVYREQNNIEDAKLMYNDAYSMYHSLKNIQGKAYTCFNLGELYRDVDSKKAINYFIKAQNLADSCNDKYLLEKNSFALYEMYKNTKNYNTSLKYYEIHNAYKDSLEHDKNVRRITELEFESNIKLLEKVNENQKLKLREEQNKRLIVRLYLIIAIIVAIIILGFSVLLFKQFREKKKAFDLLSENRKELEKAYNDLENVHSILKETNTKITDSINYAKRIQNAILPDQESISSIFKKHFIYYLPRETVSGDFFWFSEQKDYTFIAAIDCTGHGVPGAFMSMVGNTLLNQIINESAIYEPAEILTKLDQEVIKTLKQHDDKNNQEDGMELSLIRYNKATKEICYSTAGHKIVVLRSDETEIFTTSSFSIGGMHNIKKETNVAFTQDVIPYSENMRLYLYSDGIIDQFGGEKEEKIGTPRFHRLLRETATKDLTEQYTLISKFFDDWKGETAQIDDVIVIGLEF